MTDRELNEAIEKALLPEYEAMAPAGGDHLFSDEFEQRMQRLIGGKKKSPVKNTHSRKADGKNEPVRVRTSHWKAAAVAAVFIVVAAASLFMTLRSGEHIGTSDRHSADSQPSGSVADTMSEEEKHLDMLGTIAYDINDFSDKFSVQCYWDTQKQDSSEYYSYCYYQNTFGNTSFKDAGVFADYLFSRFDRLSYLGSVKCRESKQEGGSDIVNKQEYIIEPYEDTVEADIKQIFNGPKEDPEIYIKPTEYLRTHSFGVIGGITYFVSSGTGYLMIETSDKYKRTAEFSYFRAEENINDKNNNVMASDGKLALKDWEYCRTVFVTRQKRKNDKSSKYNVYNSENTAGFAFSVDSSSEQLSVSISDIKLPSGEKVGKAELEIYLQDESGKPENAAVKTELKEGRFPVDLKTPEKDKIKSVKILVHINTDKHGQVQSKDGTVTQSGYTFEVNYTMNDDT